MESGVSVGELLGLQGLDLEILEFNNRLQELEKQVDDSRNQLDELETRSEKNGAQLAEAEQRLRRFERSVQAGRATLKRLEARGQAVTNMDQHLAVRAETDAARRNLRIAEEEALDTMAEVEQLSTKNDEVTTELETVKSRWEALTSEAERSRAEIASEIAVREERKKAHEVRIEKRLLRLYRQVSGGRAAQALSPLTADGACGNCYTAVPLQRQADIKASRALAVCEGCGVIMYYTE